MEVSPLIGKTLGHYRIVEKIGHGGMGEVFLAEDTSLHRKVALKLLPQESQRDLTARKRLMREAQSAAALDHPYICHINEVGEHDGRDYIVMEYVAGQSLKERLAQGPVPEAAALHLAIEVVEAMEAAHAKGLIHRDIKPANIMLMHSGHAKVMDFGLAKPFEVNEEAGSTAETLTALTSAGCTVGTPAYMAPEQLLNQEADPRGDIWALGVTLYESVSGTQPFPGRSQSEQTSAILNREPRPLPPQVSAAFGSVVMRCLEKDPRKRYQCAAEVRAALEAIRQGTAGPSWGAWRYRLKRRRWLALPAALVIVSALLVGLDVGGLRGMLTGTGPRAGRLVRLAVLPFVNLTGDPEQEYIGDGMTDEMIAQLGSLHPQSLSVIARTSVMRYKRADKPVDQIGRELGVEYVLEGSARREGGRIRITAQLVQVRDQSQLWAGNFERELSGILRLQSEVAQKVVEALALKLLPQEQARLAKAATVDPEAYDAYLKGTQQRHSLTREGLETAERYFNLALEKNPQYAAAWAGLARVWTGRQQMEICPSSEAGPKAKAAALRAIELDDTDADAHRAVAGILTWTDWNWAAAELEWKRTVALNPNSSDALAGYSHFLMHMGRRDEALAHSRRALDLDPYNSKVRSFHALVLLSARRYGEAIDSARAALRLQPDAPVAMTALERALFMTRRFEEALDLDRARARDDSALREALERGSAEGGYAGAQRRLADLAVSRAAGPGRTSAWSVLNKYLLAGDRDRTLEWLERAYDARDPNMPYIMLPVFDSLRADPRFQSLLRRMNLPL